MNAERPFVDYYDVLRVKPNCDGKTLESAYHVLLKMYHPDHTGEADTTKFNGVIQAYRVLRDASQRAEYDVLYAQYRGDEWAEAFPSVAKEASQNTALDDADAHADILMFLYKKRRENAQNAGVPAFYIQEMLNCSDAQMDFHQWYLKEKGFLMVTEQGTLAITVLGIDHVITMSRKTKAEKLLITQSVPDS